MRGLVTTTAVAAVLVAGIVGVGFGIQAATLGKPDRGQLLVVHAIARMLPYQTSDAQIAINGTPLTTRCRTRWLDKRIRTIVHVAHGRTIEEIGRHLQDDTKQRFARFELAGCPRPLRKWMATQINMGTTIRVSDGLLDGMPVERLRFPGAALGLTVYLSRSSGLPVALRLVGPSINGFARLHYTERVTLEHGYRVIGAGSP